MIKTENYPVFKPNQVLSDGQMNEIMAYLAPQDRETRTLAIGRGILHGLTLSAAAGKIRLLPGAGLTSSGHLIGVYTPTEFTYCKAFIPNAPYAPFLSENLTDHIELLELTRDHDAEDPTSVALSGLVLEDYVVVIFLNEYEFDLTTCLPENCDNQGSEQRFEWRVLLLKQSDALNILKNADSRLGAAIDEAEITAILHAKYDLKKITLRKPLLGPENVKSYATLTKSYQAICQSELQRFKDALSAAYMCYQPLLGTININQALEMLYAHFRRLRDGRGLQYFWDFLDDLFHAYNEFVVQAFLVDTLPGVSPGAFSHHLFIGAAKSAAGCRPTIYRHYFTPARKTYIHGNLFEDVQTLFQRIILLIKGFVWKAGETKLRVTPQVLGRDFEDRAIPHYINRDTVRSVWGLTAKHRCQQDLIPSYQRENDHLLQENLTDYNHLRIEGHMYRKKEAVVAELEKLRTTYNLPFKVKCLELGALPELSSGGCTLGGLRMLYEITRLDVLCFIEDKVRFLNSIVADDLTFDTPEEEREEFEKQRKPTRIEQAKKLEFAEVIDFSRNRVFTNQKRKAQKMSGGSVEIRGDGLIEPRAADSTVSTRMMIYEPTKTTIPYEGRKKSRFEADFDEAELDGISVPAGIKEIIDRKPATPRVIMPESFEAQLAPKADVAKKAIPVEEDSTSFTIRARDIALAFPKTPVTDYVKYPKDELGDRLLSELVGNLVKMLEELPEEIHLLDTDAIQKIYAIIKDKALALKDIVEELLGSQDYVSKGVEYGLISELLELIDAGLDLRLAKIAEIHNTEWQAAENAGILADYIQKHPTLHHCGGVHIGGTHVLVSGYIDKVREITRIKELTRPVFVKAPMAVYKELRGNVYENVLRTASHFNRKAFTWSKRIDRDRIIDKTLTKADPAPAVTLDKTRSALLSGLIRSVERSGDEELILFDFCHQYICCSECASVEYIVVAELKLYLPKLAFCADDSESYAFGVYPPGGVVNGTGVKKIGDTYYFIPANSVVGEQLFTYSFGGQNIQLVANILPRPLANFSHTVAFVTDAEGIATAAVVQFTNLSTDAEASVWDFGDGITSKEDSPSHTYDISSRNTFKVTLNVKNAACGDAEILELILVPITFYIEKHLTEFCGNDETAYPLIAEPVEGGEFGENSAIDVDNRTFHPMRVNLNGERKISVTLVYQLDQQQAALPVVIYALPQPQFETEIVESGDRVVFVRFINRSVNGNEFMWDFGDGQTSRRPDPTHEYTLSGEANFTIQLTAVNGPCNASVTKQISLTPLQFSFDEGVSGSFCDNDETGARLIGTPEGGKFSGSGVSGNRFIPARVEMGALSKQTVTLQYTLGANTATLRAVVYKYPVLNFKYQAKPARLGVTVAFSNQSMNAEKYVWDFGDGTGEFDGYHISHFYKIPNTYQVTLRGINPPCEARLEKLVVAKSDDTQPPEIVPLKPLKVLTDLLSQRMVIGMLKEYGVNGQYLSDFYRQMADIVASGKEQAIAEFSMDEFQFVGPANEVLKIGDLMYRYGRGLPEAQLSAAIALYRLSIGNVMNVLAKRTVDLGTRSELFSLLGKLSEQAEKVGPHVGFERFPTEGFELVPRTWFDGLPNLQKLHLTFGNVL